MPKTPPAHEENQADLRKTMGKRIRAAREGAGLDQQEFAGKMGVAPSTASGWELGKYSPTSANLRGIVDVTGEPSSYLNPESLVKKDTIEWLSRDLGTILGKGRLRKVLELPENRLRKEIDAILGQYLVETSAKTQRRR